MIFIELTLRNNQQQKQINDANFIKSPLVTNGVWFVHELPQYILDYLNIFCQNEKLTYLPDSRGYVARPT